VAMRCDTDVDECAVNNGNCDANAICINTDEGYKCSCLPGYDGDGHSCAGFTFTVLRDSGVATYGALGHVLPRPPPGIIDFQS